MHVWVHVHVRVRMHMHVRVHVHVRMDMHVRMGVHVRVHVHVCMHMRVAANVHVRALSRSLCLGQTDGHGNRKAAQQQKSFLPSGLCGETRRWRRPSLFPIQGVMATRPGNCLFCALERAQALGHSVKLWPV